MKRDEAKGRERASKRGGEGSWGEEVRLKEEEGEE